MKVKKFVEKPAQGTAPSNLAIMGRYVLTPEIFHYLKQKKKARQRNSLTDQWNVWMMITQVYAYDFEGERYDVGEKLGFVKITMILH